jgi:hypothetical protein
VVPGVVRRVSGDRLHIELTIEGADEPIASLYRNGQLVFGLTATTRNHVRRVNRLIASSVAIVSA